MPERTDWFGRAILIVAAITLLRVAALAFDRTDLFVDESQYWFWGRNLDFGYYSKPPLIAWVIRAVTEMAGSDSVFWVRLPGPIFHGVTALILGALAARLFSAWVALWVAVSYATVPFAALGSLLISTDTIMAPLFSLALLLHFRTIETGRAGAAALTGLAIGLAFLAKYAAAYFFVGAGLAALFVPSARGSLRNSLILAVAFVATILPNVVWNLSHDFATLEHTLDNVGWVRGESWLSGVNPAGLAGFILSQFAVVGPVLFGGLLVGALRPGSERMRALVLLSLPALVFVCVQALLSRAYANWAIASYFSGILVAVPLLFDRAPWALKLSLVVNGTIAVLLPILTMLAPVPERNGKPLLARYLGRADLSRQIIDAAQDNGVSAVVAGDRDVLADLFYTGRETDLDFYAPRPEARPQNYYQQTRALPDGMEKVLLVADRAPICAGAQIAPVAEFDTTGGAYARRTIAAYIVPGECANVRS